MQDIINLIVEPTACMILGAFLVLLCQPKQPPTA